METGVISTPKSWEANNISLNNRNFSATNQVT
jgi:hypothetical protein